MSERVFYCDATGNLYYRDWWRDRADMERLAEHFEAQPKTGLYASHSLQCAAECRQAIADYDHFWMEHTDAA